MVGHSFGGTVALCYGLSFPEETAGIVALAPLCRPEARLEQALFGPRFMPGPGDALAHALAHVADPILLPLLWRAIFLPQAMPSTFERPFPAGYASGPERMPNEHYIPIDLTPFGLENPGTVFLAADEPHGLIEATISRRGTQARASAVKL